MAAQGEMSFKAEDLLARVAPDRATKRAEHAQAKEQERAAMRAKFPAMAEAVDVFRALGMAPRPLHATNQAGEEWGNDPMAGRSFLDTRCHIAGMGYEARLVEMAKKWKDRPTDYRSRQQRGIKPNAWRVDE